MTTQKGPKKIWVPKLKPTSSTSLSQNNGEAVQMVPGQQMLKTHDWRPIFAQKFAMGEKGNTFVDNVQSNMVGIGNVGKNYSNLITDNSISRRVKT